MVYFIGIDIGTTSCKTVAFSEDGEIIDSIAYAFEMLHPADDQSELDPDEILKAVVSGLKEMVERQIEQPSLVSFSCFMHSILAVDQAGGLLMPCIIWADNRSADIAEELNSSNDAQWIYEATGVPIHAMSPLCKLLWLKQHNYSLFQKAFKFLGIKEYIFYKLFGEFVVDTSVASATGLLNTASLQWDNRVLQFVELAATSLSKVIPVESVFYYKGHFSGLQLSPNIPFVVGASDGALSNLGTGATGSAMAVTIGTSGAARIIVNGPVSDKKRRTFCYHLLQNQYILGGANNNGAVVLQWLKEDLLQTDLQYEALFDLAAEVPAGANGLLFLPYLLGERAPLWNSAAKGVFFGVTISHSKATFVRATLEGVIFCLYSIIEILLEKREINLIQASGGFTKSPLWLQVLADATNKTVQLSGAEESAALGAVMLGIKALGLPAIISLKTVAEYKPDSTQHLLYREVFKKMERVYKLLEPEMNGGK